METRKTKKKSPRAPTSVDFVIAENLILYRKQRAISQEQMAKFLGITFQQVQKYERGHNRISASRLYQIAEYLKIPIADFFKGLPEYPKSPEDELLNEDNINTLRLYEELPTQEKKDIAKTIIKSLL